MTKTLNIALVAATLFAGAAHAEGDYYEGASKSAPVRSSQVDTISTGGINTTSPQQKPVADSGDYYQGASRPN